MNASMRDKVTRAILINREINKKAIELEELKVAIRDYAIGVAQKDENGRFIKVELSTESGVATVAFPKESVAIVKGGDVRVLLEDELPKTTWNSLFVPITVVKLQSEFEAAFELLKAAEKRAVKKYVEWKESTPSVSLPK